MKKPTLLNKLFRPAQLDMCAHLTPQDYGPEQLLEQVVSDANLDSALAWLRDSSSEQDHSDTWDYSRDWGAHKADLKRRVSQGQFSFQTVREVEVSNADGGSEWREIRCAEDRLLMRAMSQTFDAVFAEGIAPTCVHLAGRGGAPGAVQATYAQLQDQPTAQVMKSDVKGYYAQIDQHILYQQFCTLLPNERELQRLLWLFMHRSVERGGNYRDIERGLPLGSSLSPQLGALYLSPLDALFTDDTSHFYRRYMDDWVIVCKNRWDLRNTVKRVYAVLHALRVEVAPDKTYIGKASKGFDFLGKRILPIGILPSTAALSRFHHNTTRLYEQGASKRRIGQYWRRWLGWAVLSISCSGVIAGIVNLVVSVFHPFLKASVAPSILEEQVRMG